jgi:hypothetical protein
MFWKKPVILGAIKKTWSLMGGYPVVCPVCEEKNSYTRMACEVCKIKIADVSGWWVAYRGKRIPKRKDVLEFLEIE